MISCSTSPCALLYGALLHGALLHGALLYGALLYGALLYGALFYGALPTAKLRKIAALAALAALALVDRAAYLTSSLIRIATVCVYLHALHHNTPAAAAVPGLVPVRLVDPNRSP